MNTTEKNRGFLGRLERRLPSWGVSRSLRALLAGQQMPTRDRADRVASRVPTAFAYRKPPARDQGKEVVRLCETPIVRGSVQIVRKNAPEDLHAHEGIDGFWMVLRGRARFYGP